MPFEANGVLWKLNFTNPTGKAVRLRVVFELGGMVNELSTVGTWVCPSSWSPAGCIFCARES